MRDSGRDEKRQGRFFKKSVEVTNVHSNVSQEIIEITTDRLTLKLNSHLDQLENKRGWVAPLSLVASLITTLSTTTFEKAILSADTWRAIYIITSLISAAWLIVSVYRSYKSPSIEDIVKSLKEGC